jgi:hypothetical protein
LAVLVSSADLTRTTDVTYPQCTFLAQERQRASLPMIKNADAYGAELWDYYTTKKDIREIVERMIISSMGIEKAMAEVCISLNTRIGRLSRRREWPMLVAEF